MHPDSASPQAGTLHLPAVHLQLLLHPAGPLQPAGRAQRTVGRHLVERAAHHHHPDRAALPFPLEAGRQHPHHRGRGAGGILPDGSRQPHRVPGSVDLFQRIHLQHVPCLLNHGAAGNVLQANRPADVPVLPTDAHRHTERLLAEIHRVRRHRVRCPDGKRHVQDAPAAPNHPLFLYFHRCGQLRFQHGIHLRAVRHHRPVQQETRPENILPLRLRAFTVLHVHYGHPGSHRGASGRPAALRAYQ